jgi:hypothetical protein
VNPVPLYRFQIEVPLPQQRVMERIRSLVRERPKFWQLLGEQLKPRDNTLPPFIGSADDDSFKMLRDIRYRNSFLPLIRGHLLPTPTGTQIIVIMFTHPVVAVFMTFWLGSTGWAAVMNFPRSGIPVVGFLFGAAMMWGGFFYEAAKAKQILTDALSDPGITPQTTMSRSS